MKKRLLLLLGCFIFCNFLPHGYRSIQPSPAQLSKRLFDAHEANNVDKCSEILDKAVQIYRDDPAAYLHFLNCPNAEGFTLLQYCAATSDYKNLTSLIKRAKNFFKSDLQSLFVFLNVQGKQGYTALSLASRVGNNVTLKAFLDEAARALNNDRSLFFSFLTTRTFTSEQTPLHILVYNSSEKPVKELINKALTILGKESDNFYNVINAQDKDKATPLLYAIETKIVYFLKQHGGLVLAPVSPEQKELCKRGQELIEAVQGDDFVRFETILENAKNAYSNNKPLFVKLISCRDQEGWTAFMHAAARDRITLLHYFLDTVGKFLTNDNEALCDIINIGDKERKNALNIAIIRRHFAATDLIIKKAQLFSPNKLFFYMIMNNPEEFNSRTPLLCLTYNSEGAQEEEYYSTIALMLKLVNNDFHKKSYAFYYFINAQDNFKSTALSYTNSQKIRKLLETYGAFDSRARHGQQKRTRFISTPGKKDHF